MATSAKLLVRVNGGAPQSGGITVPPAASVLFQFADTNGWRKYKLTIIGPPSWPLPAGWTDEDGAFTFTGVTTPPPALTLPGITLWGKFMIELVVDDGLRNGVSDPELRDRKTALSMLSANGLEDFGVREESQFGGSTRGWAASLQALARKIASAGSGTKPSVDANHVYLWKFEEAEGASTFVDTGSAGAGLILVNQVAGNPNIYPAVRAGQASPLGRVAIADAPEGTQGFLSCATTLPSWPTTNWSVEGVFRITGVNQLFSVGSGSATVVGAARSGNAGLSSGDHYVPTQTYSSNGVTPNEFFHLMISAHSAYTNPVSGQASGARTFVSYDGEIVGIFSGVTRPAISALQVFKLMGVTGASFSLTACAFLGFSNVARPLSWARSQTKLIRGY